MKYLILAGLLFLNACTHEPTTSELLNNMAMRDSIMQAISNDHALATQMINNLENSNATDLMKSNCDFMKSKKGGQLIKSDTTMRNLLLSNLIFLVNSDSISCDKTCTQLYQNPQSNAVLKAKMNLK